MLKDEKLLNKAKRDYLGGGRVAFQFGNTTVVAEEWVEDDGTIHLRPQHGEYFGRNGWAQLSESDVAAYCEMLEERLNRKEKTDGSEE